MEDDDNVVNSGRKYLEHISISVSLLGNLLKYDEEDESILKDDVRSLKAGIDFLRSHHLLLINKYLANRMKDLAAHVKHTLTTYQRENEVLDMVKLEDVYVSFLIQVKTFVNSMTFCKFQDDIDSRHNYREHIYLLLENILEALSCWYDNYNTTTALSKKVGELRMVLMYYKPLCRCLAQSWHLDNLVKYAPLDLVLSKAVVATFLLLVNETNIESQILSLKRILRHDYECSSDIYVRFLEFNSSECSSNVKGQFYILDNLIDILGSNSDSLNEANNHLHVELTVLRTFVANQIEGEMLDHFLGLTAATEAICYKAVPIVVSCYMEEVELEEHMRWKLNDILADVIGQIKMIKRRHGSQQIKLYDYPRVDGLGYLEFFLVHLKELQVHEKISVIRSEIEALHKNIHCLMSSPKTQEKLPCEGLWETIVRLAYQVEYVIDLYLVIPDSRCISTFLNIVEDIKEIIEILLSRPDKSHLVEEVAVTASSHNHSMPLQQNNEVLGFKEEIDDILNYLLEGEEDLQVISVVAMAGAGKTSLVKHLFNESLVIGHFDRKAWCTVSKSYQTRGLLLTLLNQIKAFEFDIRKIEDQDIADELCRSLKKCRYLVVIDDVWDVAVWNDMSRYFPNDKTQSRILITTRDHNVASETKSKIHELRALSEDESWKLLQSKLSQQENLPKTLVIIAKEVAKSCKGLPLSIVVIGGLLSNTARNEEMWNQIAKDVTSNVLNDPQGKCEDILELSYNDLPNHLKSCLLYLGVFPEDHKILVSRLVRLWVAEGLVRGEITSEECVEEVGKRYVDDLIARSLAIPIKEKTVGGVKIFQLHDLLRDFCLKKAKEEHFFTALDSRDIFDLSQSLRRMSINHSTEKHLPFTSLNNTRTIISFCKSNLVEHILKSEHMMLLNVLDLHELVDPASYVHRFVHLRYLAIWKIDRCDHVLIQSLISKMWKLQILILSGSYNVFEIPDFIWDLVKLRHIHLRPSALFPPHDTKRLEDSHVLLENLKYLSKPQLHYGDSSWLSKLPELQKLSCIFFYSRDDILLRRYRFLELNLCNRLTSLKVENGAKRYIRERGKMQLPASLRKLSLSKFKLDSDDISEIGKSLPSLEVLKLHDSFESWSVNDEDFPKLKVLKISGGYCREWHASEDSFPSLERLFLERCYTLGGIPLCFGDIPCLLLISIKYCNSSVYESARDIEKIQAEAQNLELKLNIKSVDASVKVDAAGSQAVATLALQL